MVFHIHDYTLECLANPFAAVLFMLSLIFLPISFQTLISMDYIFILCAHISLSLSELL